MDHDPTVKFALYSDLSTYAQQINLNLTQIVMMKRFMKTLYASREFSASQFLNNQIGSQVRSYNNEQLFEIDKQIRPFIHSLNEIKLDMHTLSLPNSTNLKQNYVRLQIFMRQKDLGCFEQVYGTFDDISHRKFSHQTLVVPVH